MINTIKNDVSEEIVIRKSRFIANVFYTEAESEAKFYIKKMNQQYYDAKHNCYAYIIEEADEYGTNKIKKSSDDGEPSGTAGAPILDTLEKKGLSNILVVVTRYFGGILLGTGGLVKAYTDVTCQALENAELVKREIGNMYLCQIKYEDLKNFQYFCSQIGIKIADINYSGGVAITVEATNNKFMLLQQKMYGKLKSQLTVRNIWIEC